MFLSQRIASLLHVSMPVLLKVLNAAGKCSKELMHMAIKLFGALCCHTLLLWSTSMTPNPTPAHHIGFAGTCGFCKCLKPVTWVAKYDCVKRIATQSMLHHSPQYPPILKNSPAYYTAVTFIKSNAHDCSPVCCSGKAVGTVMTCHAMQALWPPKS